MLVELSKEQAEFIKANAEMFSVGDRWYRFPMWYRHVTGNVFEVVPFDEIPEGVKKDIQKLQNNDTGSLV